MILPAISIQEPWASMIASGKKTIEVRSWKTNHRGTIVLCASKKVPGKYAGHAFALADIIEVRKMEPGDEKHAGGFFDPNQFSWVLSNVRRFKKFPIIGKIGVFKIDTKLRKTI